MELSQRFAAAANAVQGARAMVITAGAGMGVDSGLPDFRGARGFWNAYPMYERLGISFMEAANPAHFEDDPAFGWGFYGHRANLYRETIPHAGFAMLLEWCRRFRLDCFVVTSNVDGQFQKAGFSGERILEVHGSIHYLQCVKPCTAAIWENDENVPVDFATMRAGYFPRCIHCGGVARPNVLMFDDWSWVSARTVRQERLFSDFIASRGRRGLVVVEIGAGTAIPTIRRMSEELGRRCGAAVIRVNPCEGFIAEPHISIPCGGVEGIAGINALLCPAGA